MKAVLVGSMLSIAVASGGVSLAQEVESGATIGTPRNVYLSRYNESYLSRFLQIGGEREFQLHQYSRIYGNPNEGVYADTTGGSITFRVDRSIIDEATSSGNGPNMEMRVRLMFANGKILESADQAEPNAEKQEVFLSLYSSGRGGCFQGFSGRFLLRRV